MFSTKDVNLLDVVVKEQYLNFLFRVFRPPKPVAWKAKKY